MPQTLEEAIFQSLPAAVSDPSLVDLTNQRNREQSSNVDESALLAYATSAAAHVKSLLGSSVDGDDAFAVEAGKWLALMLSASVYGLMLTEVAMQFIREAKDNLREEARLRRGRVGPQKSPHSSAGGGLLDLDRRYPVQDWGE